MAVSHASSISSKGAARSTLPPPRGAGQGELQPLGHRGDRPEGLGRLVQTAAVVLVQPVDEGRRHLGVGPALPAGGEGVGVEGGVALRRPATRGRPRAGPGTGAIGFVVRPAPQVVPVSARTASSSRHVVVVADPVEPHHLHVGQQDQRIASSGQVEDAVEVVALELEVTGVVEVAELPAVPVEHLHARSRSWRGRGGR